jgi:hypothetical protein
VVLLVTRNGILYAGEMLIRFFRFVISRISLSPVELSGLIWIFWWCHVLFIFGNLRRASRPVNRGYYYPVRKH